MDITRHRYQITDLQNAWLATMTIAQGIDAAGGQSVQYCTGRVTVEFEYLDASSGSPTPATKFPLDAKWFPEHPSPVPSFTMRIGDFILPPELCRRGIGTLCWSEIYRTFPLPPGFSLILSGGLSDKDATMTGTILGKAQTIDNIARRDSFWQRMLDPATLTFESDEQGEGFFRGRFVDPAGHLGYIPKAIATRI